MSYVEVIYSASTNEIIQHKVPFAEGLTISSVLEKSGLLKLHPEVLRLDVGVFSTIKSSDYVVKPKDRIEIYRPLLACPKDKRRERANNKKRSA